MNDQQFKNRKGSKSLIAAAIILAAACLVFYFYFAPKYAVEPATGIQEVVHESPLLRMGPDCSMFTPKQGEISCEDALMIAKLQYSGEIISVKDDGEIWSMKTDLTDDVIAISVDKKTDINGQIASYKVGETEKVILIGNDGGIIEEEHSILPKRMRKTNTTTPTTEDVISVTRTLPSSIKSGSDIKIRLSITAEEDISVISIREKIPQGASISNPPSKDVNGAKVYAKLSDDYYELLILFVKKGVTDVEYSILIAEITADEYTISGDWFTQVNDEDVSGYVEGDTIMEVL